MKRSAISLVPLMLVLATPVMADVHWGIISTVRTTPKTTAAFIVASDQPGEVVFTVFPDGVPAISDTVALDLEGFASSASADDPAIQNLFTGSGATTALVRAVFTNGSSGAVLEQTSVEGRSITGVPPVGQARGQVFLIPVGDLRQGTSVIVGNVSDFDTEVVVRYGNGPQEAPRLLRRDATLVIDVPQPNTLMRLVSTISDALVIAVLAVDTGRTTEMTDLAPLQAP